MPYTASSASHRSSSEEMRSSKSKSSVASIVSRRSTRAPALMYSALLSTGSQLTSGASPAEIWVVTRVSSSSRLKLSIFTLATRGFCSANSAPSDSKTAT